MLSSAEGRDLIAGLEETGRLLVSELNNVDEETAGATPEPDEWSIKQNIAHLSEIEPGLIDEALAIIADPDTPIGHPPGSLWGEAQDTANSRPLSEIIREFDEVSRHSLQRLAALTDQDLGRRGRHLGYGDVTVLSTLMVVLAHRRGHLFQNRSNVLSLRACESGQVPAEAYTVAGDGRTALLLLDSAASKWDPVIAALGDGYRVIHYKFAALPQTIELLRRQLNLSELWLGGVASGAIDACKYAFAYPQYTAGLVLVNLTVLPFSRDGRPDDFASIIVPTLTLVGEGYPQVTLAVERGRQFPNGRVLVVPKSGRDVPREQPATVAEAIREIVPLKVGA